VIGRFNTDVVLELDKIIVTSLLTFKNRASYI
jgi:hypothetical protein